MKLTSLFTTICKLLVLVFFFVLHHPHFHKPESTLQKTTAVFFDIPYAEEKPDPTIDYNIVISEHAIDSPDSLNWALNNVARLLNVHVMAGVKQALHVVLAIHGGTSLFRSYLMKLTRLNTKQAILTLLHAFAELEKAGVKMFVCE